eukprot:TRINITY_DN14550_c0_g1_i1.p1 TRINITY_DN14550_c0_g1~~TRINITY_DN14550_c0_g1_i1.p1  ORF type:complete len:637 (+),score=86.67 TRINITY_DN14550_c0_g1_i1:194-1912(+)
MLSKLEDAIASGFNDLKLHLHEEYAVIHSSFESIQRTLQSVCNQDLRRYTQKELAPPTNESCEVAVGVHQKSTGADESDFQLSTSLEEANLFGKNVCVTRERVTNESELSHVSKSKRRAIYRAPERSLTMFQPIPPGALASMADIDFEHTDRIMRDDFSDVFSSNENEQSAGSKSFDGIIRSDSVVPACVETEGSKRTREDLFMKQILGSEGEWSESIFHASQASPNTVVSRDRLPLPHKILSIFGILALPGCSQRDIYGKVMLCLVFLLSVVALHFAVVEDTIMYSEIASVTFAVGTFCGLIALRVQDCRSLLGPISKPLEGYASKHGFFAAWMSTSMRHFWIVVILWLSSVLARAAPYYFFDEIRHPEVVLSLCVFAGIAAVFGGIMYLVLHVTCCLELIVDMFCIRFYSSRDFETGVKEWNAVQAILRRAAHIIDGCFMSVQAAVGVTLLLSGSEIVTANWRGDARLAKIAFLRYSGWLPVAFLILYCLFRAAAVTGRCLRAPALVNSLICSSEDSVNLERQYMVAYMEQSKAGFYFLGIRLTCFMVFKCFYGLMLLTFTLVTQLGSDG